MARYTGPRCRQCRREGIKLYLKGDKCFSDKCPIEKRNYGPGQHGQRRKKVSEYGLQLREKQKLRRTYGLLEKQFHGYFVKANRKEGVTGENLLSMLERRLDNVVYRLGLAASRSEARQLVRHGHFTVNGRKVNIPSYLVRAGETIGVRERSKESLRIKEMIERAKESTRPEWLDYDTEQATGRVISLPTREQIEVPVQEHLIVELYSR